MPHGGKRPGSGRKKGGTKDVREAIMETFSILGGVEYLYGLPQRYDVQNLREVTAVPVGTRSCPASDVTWYRAYL
jgi:hypothetical protein